MGTRGAVGLVLDGKTYAAYNHFDSYPDGLGEEVVDFCHSLSPRKWETLKKNLKKIKWIKKGSKPTPEEQKLYEKYADLNVGEQSLGDWYCLLRDFQGVEGLKAILNGKLKHWTNDADFLKDDTWCEYAYVINVDTKKLVFYEMTKKVGEVPIPRIPKNWKSLFDNEENE